MKPDEEIQNGQHYQIFHWQQDEYLEEDSDTSTLLGEEDIDENSKAKVRNSLGISFRLLYLSKYLHAFVLIL